jgi:hypothetical protein
MLVIFETIEKELLKVDLEHVPSKGEAVTVFDTVYQVDNVMYETTIRIKPSGKRSVKQIATCEISPIVLGDFQADKKEDKWEPRSEFCNKEETGSAEDNICNTCLFKGKCPSENEKEVYEICETIKKQAELYFKNKEVAE